MHYVGRFLWASLRRRRSVSDLVVADPVQVLSYFAEEEERSCSVWTLAVPGIIEVHASGCAGVGEESPARP